MAAQPNSVPQTFHGSCHCGRIKYTVTLSLPPQPIGNRCNCSVCTKAGFTGIHLSSPETEFKLLSPSSWSEVPDYIWSNPEFHRRFCDKCGVQVFFHCRGVDGDDDLFGFNVNTLDQPQEGLELSEWKMVYWDGKHENWAAGTKEQPWKGGMV